MQELYSQILSVKHPRFFSPTELLCKVWNGGADFTNYLGKYVYEMLSIADFLKQLQLYLIFQTKTFIVFLNLVHHCFCFLTGSVKCLGSGFGWRKSQIPCDTE